MDCLSGYNEIMIVMTDLRRKASIVLALPLLVLAGCSRGEEVTKQSLLAARERWDKTGIRDYILEWTNSGPGNPRYHVEVQDGTVRSVRFMLPDGTMRDSNTHEPRYFGIEGLFLTITEECAQLRTDTPFGQQKGASIVQRFTPDPKYGFPRSYRRDVAGSLKAISFDVTRFEPRAPAQQADRAP